MSISPEWLVAIGTAAGTLLSLLFAVYHFSGRLAVIEDRVKTMWDFLWRRAQSEVIKDKLGVMNSPIVVHDSSKEWMRGLAKELRTFYERLGRHLSDKELAFEIERQFGDRLLAEVCIPHGLHLGACLVIAVQVAKEMDTGSGAMDVVN